MQTNTHFLDKAESDIRFVVQIEADIGRSKAESNIISQSICCITNGMSGEALSNKCFIMPKVLKYKKVSRLWQKFNRSNKCFEGNLPVIFVRVMDLS